MNAKDLSVVVRGIAPVVREYVALGLTGLADRIKALEAIPAGRDGKDGAAGSPGEKGQDGAPGPQGERGPEGQLGPPGRDGVTGAKGLDGLTGERGQDGPEGKPGRDGRDGVPGVAGAPGEKGLDGLHGKDGQDGLGFDDLDVLYDGERGVTFRFTKGDRVKDFPLTLPMEIYRGVYTEKAYARGDSVTWAGSEWHCNEPTTTKPGDGSKAWTLKVKRGRDGKDGAPGADGKPGRDLTKEDVPSWRS